MRDLSASLIPQSPLVSGDRPEIFTAVRPTENSGLINNNGSSFPVSPLILVVILLLASLLTGWQWFLSQRKIKQLQQEKIKQTENLDQALLTLQDHLNSPDLQGSKILALDYLRMRLDEEVFRYQIIHQVQEQLTNLISQLVKSTLPEPSPSKQIVLDRLIEIEYDLEGLEGKWYRCTVLRIHLQLRKLPLQSSSNTIKQMVEAITVFLNHPQGQSEWKTPLQEQCLALRWESSNQPLPLLNLQNYPAKTRDSTNSHSPNSPTPTESLSSSRLESLAYYAP